MCLGLRRKHCGKIQPRVYVQMHIRATQIIQPLSLTNRWIPRFAVYAFSVQPSNSLRISLMKFVRPRLSDWPTAVVLNILRIFDRCSIGTRIGMSPPDDISKSHFARLQRIGTLTVRDTHLHTKGDSAESFSPSNDACGESRKPCLLW